MQMKLDNGTFAAYQQCNFTPDYWRSYVVIGDAGRIENFDNGEAGTHIKEWTSRKRGWDARADHTVEIPLAAGGNHGADPIMIEEFLSFARGEAKSTTNALDARWSVAAGAAATESLRNGGVPVQVPSPPLAQPSQESAP